MVRRGRGLLPELVTNLANRHGRVLHAVRRSMPFHVLLAHMSYTQYAQINVNLEPTAAIPFTPPLTILLFFFYQRAEPAFNKTEMKLNIPQLLTKCQV